jgi:hypothetical protein
MAAKTKKPRNAWLEQLPGTPSHQKAVERGETPLPAYPTKEDIAAVTEHLEKSAAAAPNLAASIKRAHDAALKLGNSGVTTDTLALLIAEKAPWLRNGKRVSPETVIAVMKGAAKLDECLAPVEGEEGE